MSMNKIDVEKSVNTVCTESRELLASDKVNPEEETAPEDGWRGLLKRACPSCGEFRFQSAVRC